MVRIEAASSLKPQASSLKLGAWNLELGAWSLELAACRLPLPLRIWPAHRSCLSWRAQKIAKSALCAACSPAVSSPCSCCSTPWCCSAR
ncbi:hypothetical protein CW358_13290 [Pseudomonas protegens]|nr:hypothetical protein CW358_13290 [Pseudomonas protegens]